MTVEELKDVLLTLPPEAEVRFASQPSWPFEYDIDSAISVRVLDRDGEKTDESIVYLEEGRQIGYLPSNVKIELEW